MVNLPVTPVENCRQPFGGLLIRIDKIRSGISYSVLVLLHIWIEAFQLCHFDFPLPVTAHICAEEHEVQGRRVRGHGAHVDVNCREVLSVTDFIKRAVLYVLCCPEFCPHIVGMGGPPVLVVYELFTLHNNYHL